MIVGAGRRRGGPRALDTLNESRVWSTPQPLSRMRPHIHISITVRGEDGVGKYCYVSGGIVGSVDCIVTSDGV